MKTVFPGRQILLFLLAVTLPCFVVVAMGLRLVAQDVELAEKRAADERRRIVTDVRQELMARLERIRTAAVAPNGPATDSFLVFAARVRNGRLALPWEETTRLGGPGSLPPRHPAANLVQRGEREEFAGRADAAVALYRKAAASTDPAVTDWSRFLLARALATLGQHREADLLNTGLAALSFDVTDEHAMPLALYAVKRLMDRRGTAVPQDFVTHALDAFAGTRWMAPTTLYMLVEIAARQESFGPESRAPALQIRQIAASRIADVEHLEALRTDVAALLPRAATPGSEQRWHLHGQPAWLVNASYRSGGTDLVLTGVVAAPLIAALSEPNGATRVRLAGDGSGESIGENFPGVRVAYTTVDEGRALAKGRLQQRFYLAALAMVISITLLGGYLLWRDVSREMRMAATRAQFVASISHELKTPLTSIRMFAETLRMRPEDAAMRGEYLDTIVSESERLTRLLSNVLDFSRIEQARKTYRLAPASLADVVRAAARTLEYPLAQAGFELAIDIDESVPFVRADCDGMLQAVLNLLTNAMKFSGVSRRIDLSLARAGGRAVISVTDQGIGIDAREHARLFDRFYRVRTTESEQIAGTGLGLTIVQHIVQAHHGLITVRSAPGEGSTFSISVPLMDPPQSEPAGQRAEVV